MKHGYLAQESQRINKATRKTFVMLVLAFICALTIIYFLGKDSINFSDISYGSISFYLIILIGLMLLASVIKVLATGRTAENGNNLFLAYKENTKEAVGNIIDIEGHEEKILVEEYIGQFTNKSLMPSYLLLCGVKGGLKGTSKVTAIPRDKICWVCDQVGIKGGPFIVKLLIFTENKILQPHWS